MHVYDFTNLTILAGQVKLGVHAMRLCQIKGGSESDNDIKSSTLVALLRLLESRIAFNNVFLRHHLFCILRILAGRCAQFMFSIKRKIKISR